MKKPLPPLRVRHEPPTLDEAVEAALGVTDDLQLQAEFAAELMGLQADDVMPPSRRPSAPQPRPSARSASRLRTAPTSRSAR